MSENSFDRPETPQYWRKLYTIVLVAHALAIIGLLLFTLAFHG
jgi:hypothetical protein